MNTIIYNSPNTNPVRNIVNTSMSLVLKIFLKRYEKVTRYPYQFAYYQLALHYCVCLSVCVYKD